MYRNVEKSVIDSIPKKYVLFIGSRNIYKNFYFFVEAVATLLKKDKELYLICVGGGPFSGDEQAYFKHFGLENKIIHFVVNDDTLTEVYKRAIALVYPSLYEGFGIPILEAFSCGCPVILSDKSSLPEIAGDAAIYFNPKDIKSMGDAIGNTLYNQELLEKLRQKGYNQLKKYTWEDCANKTISLYESLL